MSYRHATKPLFVYTFFLLLREINTRLIFTNRQICYIQFFIYNPEVTSCNICNLIKIGQRISSRFEYIMIIYTDYVLRISVNDFMIFIICRFNTEICTKYEYLKKININFISKSLLYFYFSKCPIQSYFKYKRISINI